jgi:hypothetical protein
MKASAIWAGAALLAAAVRIHGPCRADEPASAAGPGGILGALAGASVPAAELSGQHARGSQNININTSTTYNNDTSYTADSGSALSSGSLKNNAVIGTSDTGMITTTGSVNNNTGIATVIQNTGNNSLFQVTTTIYLTMH